MRYILILLLFISGAVSAQFQPTSSKTALKWGVSIGTRDSSAYAANDSLVVTINRAGRMMYRSTDGYWKLLANAASSDYVPYTGAVDNVNLGNFRLTARSIRTDSVYANSSAGMYLLTNSGSAVAHWGGGGSVEVDFHGFAGYDANRSASYTARSFTDKNYVDSADGLRLLKSDTAAMLANRLKISDTAAMLSPYARTSSLGSYLLKSDSLSGGYTTWLLTKKKIDSLGAVKLSVLDTAAMLANRLKISDTAAMLAPFVQYSDTTGLFSNIVRTFGTQTIGGSKAFSSDIVVNGVNIGSGSGNINSNVRFGASALPNNTTGVDNVSIGLLSLRFNTTGNSNVGVGSLALQGNTTGTRNIGIGESAMANITTGSDNIGIGYLTSSPANNTTNQIVIGSNTNGNGSNTVTIGNSSITNNYFNGNIRSSNGTAFLKNMANGSSSDSVIVSNNGELRKIAQSSIVGSGGTVTSVSAGTGMSFTTITGTGAVNADTTILGTRAFTTGGLVAKANTSLNNVNGVLSSTYGGAGSVSGILKANGSGVVSAAVAGTDYVIPSALSAYLPLSGGTLTGNSVVQNSDGLTFWQLNNTSTGGNIYTLISAGASNPHSESAGTFYIRNSTTNTTPFKISSSNVATFTGALSGTSLSMSGAGTFNGVMSLGNDATYGTNYKTLGLTGNADGSHRIFAGTADDLYIAAATSRGIRFWTNGTANNALIIASSGAATFSSSVTATQFNLFANNKVSNQTTSQTITSYTVPSDGLYMCSGSLVFTANSGSGTFLQVNWTQAETNTAGSCNLTPAITGVFPVNATPVTVYAKAGTVISINSVILGGTATYSASGVIQLIKAY